MQSYLSRFAISRKVSTWTISKLIIVVVAKMTFDLLPEQPSCNVTGLSSARSGNSATQARSGLTTSVVLPESKSVYALIPLMETYAARHISSIYTLWAHNCTYQSGHSVTVHPSSFLRFINCPDGRGIDC